MQYCKTVNFKFIVLNYKTTLKIVNCLTIMVTIKKVSLIFVRSPGCSLIIPLLWVWLELSLFLSGDLPTQEIIANWEEMPMNNASNPYQLWSVLHEL